MLTVGDDVFGLSFITPNRIVNRLDLSSEPDRFGRKTTDRVVVKPTYSFETFNYERTYS